MTQSSLFTFYRQILARGWSWWTHGFGARLTGWEASFGHLINLYLSSHPNITTCWSFLWGDSVSPERDLPDSPGEGGCRCLAEGCLRTRLKKAARRFVVLKVGLTASFSAQHCLCLPLQPAIWDQIFSGSVYPGDEPLDSCSWGRASEVGGLLEMSTTLLLPPCPSSPPLGIGQWPPVMLARQALRGPRRLPAHLQVSFLHPLRSLTFHTSLKPWLTGPVHTFLLSRLIPLLSCEGLGVSVNTFQATTFN